MTSGDYLVRLNRASDFLHVYRRVAPEATAGGALVLYRDSGGIDALYAPGEWVSCVGHIDPTANEALDAAIARAAKGA